MNNLFKPAKIQFDELSINQLSNNSGIFMGKNTQMYWSTGVRSCSGFGTLAGKNNQAFQNIHLVHPESREGSTS
jgi:hypothetical protein